MKIFLYLFFLYALTACTQNSHPNDVPVAKVFDSQLMRSEVVAFIPAGTPKDDSVLMAQSYIRNWITNKLLLHKAIENLSDQEKNIQKQVEDYRTSLLVHQYKQKLIAQKLSEDIAEKEIEDYYEANKFNFVLSTPIIKAVYVVIPKSASNINDVRKWYKSDKAGDMEKLEEYCLTNARKYDDFNENWIELKYVSNLLPGDGNVLENEVKRTKNIEKEDDDNFYFLKINELCPEQTVAPLGYVRDEIILILKNKKKLQFENDLDKKINEEAIRKNYVKMY